MSDISIPVTSGRTKVDDVFVYYEIVGEGHPLVLIHASITDRRMWDDQFQEFARHGYRVIRYDMRGFGLSSGTTGPFAPYEDLYQILTSLGVERTHVLGLSIGGTIGIDLTVTHPDAVDKLIAVWAGPTGYRPEHPGPVEHVATAQAEIDRAVQTGDLERALEMYLRTWVDGLRRLQQVKPDVRERIAAMAMEVLMRRREQGKPTPPDPPAITKLGDLVQPTLVIVGDQDVPAVHAAVDYLTTHLAGARKVIIPEAAHFPNMDNPETLNEVVLDFLDE